MKVLVIDLGGTHIKALVTGATESRKIDSGASLTPLQFVDGVKQLVADWSYDMVSIGYPGLVVRGAIAAEPRNLGTGWVGFDFHAAFGVPVKLINDGAMQALGSYTGGRMFFLGLGTGLASAMICDGDLLPMELGHLPYKNGRTYEDYVGKAGLARSGKRTWRKRALRFIELFRAALEPEYVVIGGGNAKYLIKSGDTLPKGISIGANANAFTGGFRIWEAQKRS